MRRLLIVISLIVSASAFGQVSNPSIISVSVAPSGSCSSGLPNQQVISTGTQYSCQNGTWAAIGGTGSGVTQIGHFVDTQLNPLLSPAAGDFLNAFGTVAYSSGTYYMSYCYQISSAYNIGLATSTDGKTWTKDAGANPILAPSGGSNWDATGVCTSIIWLEGGTWYMLYRGQSGAGTGVGLATATTPAGPWTRQATNQCPAPENVGNGCVVPAGVLAVGDTSEIDPYGLIKIGSTYQLGINDVTNGTSRRVGYASSTDLIHWTKNAANPFFTGGAYCQDTFKDGSYYYTIISKYVGGSTAAAEFELYRSASFPPASSSGFTYLGVLKHGTGNNGTAQWNNFGLDTPDVLMDDITQSTHTVTGNDLWLYYAGSDTTVHTNFYTGLAIAAGNPATQTQEQDNGLGGFPNGGVVYGSLSLAGGTSAVTLVNGTAAAGVGAVGTYYGGISAYSDGTNFKFEILPGNKFLEIASDSFINWSSTTAAGGTKGTGLSRTAAGVLAVGNGTAANASGTIEAASFQQGTTGPTWTSGSSAPTGNCSIGSFFSNTGAASASTAFYVCYPANTWNAVTVP